MISKWFKPQDKRFNLIALGLLLIAGWIIYANCIGNEMFWDDDDFILKNRYIKDVSFWPLWFKENMVAGNYFVSNYWRPALLAVFTLEWHWFKDWVYGWHFISVMGHICAGMLVYTLFCQLFNQRLWAFIIALIFIVHPAHNEAVVYVNSFGDSLATLCVLFSLIAYARFRQQGQHPLLSRSYYVSLLMFPIAVMSKETGFILCALLPFMDFVLLQKDASWFKRGLKVLHTTWPLIGMAIIYVILRATVLNFSNSFNFYNETNEFTSNIFLRILTFFKAVTQYAGFLFMPYELRVERQMPWAKSLFEIDVLWGGLLVGVLLWSFFKNFKTRPWITFGIGWFFIAIIPASNVLVPINAVLYEHFLYAPMIGLVSVVVGLWFNLNWPPVMQKIGLGLLIAYLIFFAIIGIRRNADWHTAIGFYEKLVAYSPSYRVINNLGMEYADKGIHDKALIWYTKAIEMQPNNPVAYHNIAGTYRDTGHIDKALVNFKKAIELNPEFIFSYRSLAELYWRVKDYPQSYKYLYAVHQFDPNDANVTSALKTLDALLKGSAQSL